MSINKLPAILGWGKGRANFMGAWIFWFFLQEKTSMPIKFLVLGEGGYFVFWGGGSAKFIFMGAGIFLS